MSVCGDDVVSPYLLAGRRSRQWQAGWGVPWDGMMGWLGAAISTIIGIVGCDLARTHSAGHGRRSNEQPGLAPSLYMPVHVAMRRRV